MDSSAVISSREPVAGAGRGKKTRKPYSIVMANPMATLQPKVSTLMLRRTQKSTAQLVPSGYRSPAQLDAHFPP